MNQTISMLGLGKLGLPLILAIESQGFKVIGYDVNEDLCNRIKAKQNISADVKSYHLEKSSLKIVDLPKLVALSDILFVCVQTPHDKMYEGITPLPDERKDFDYSYLKAAIEAITDQIIGSDRGAWHLKSKVVVIMSTVLPGTIDREIMSLIQFASGEERIHLVYSPQFPAMDTVAEDFMNPEFILLGTNNQDTLSEAAIDPVEHFYNNLYRLNDNPPPIIKVSIKEAEMIKMAYNAFVGMKIGFANTLMEICYKMGMNIDNITGTLKLANRRLISTAYMNGGMGDGGGCHNRDQMALSFLAKRLDLSFDWFETINKAREKQTEWFADMIIDKYHWNVGELPVVILGKAYKPNIAMQDGSPALLLDNILLAKGFQKHATYDPFEYEKKGLSRPLFDSATIFFIATKHDIFKDYIFPKGSVVFDPFGYIDDRDGVEVIRIGRHE